ncbi:hypothetical protein D777_01172 [Marinobacter nitratireducens]|uniref:Uncharacterized protein n=1 Tax=Marinobacter nitratireducens TaxID=1137280 RepID=A0A072N6E2_9GAMM|nr:hypothetical protein D777_01172 [Marinobacter nitratireducens]
MLGDLFGQTFRCLKPHRIGRSLLQTADLQSAEFTTAHRHPNALVGHFDWPTSGSGK